jgi:hypothetical protein
MKFSHTLMSDSFHTLTHWTQHFTRVCMQVQSAPPKVPQLRGLASVVPGKSRLGDIARQFSSGESAEFAAPEVSPGGTLVAAAWKGKAKVHPEETSEEMEEEAEMAALLARLSPAAGGVFADTPLAGASGSSGAGASGSGVAAGVGHATAETRIRGRPPGAGGSSSAGRLPPLGPGASGVAREPIDETPSSTVVSPEKPIAPLRPGDLTPRSGVQSTRI